jgi:phage shock protein A
MDLGRDVAPDLASEINSLEEDEKINEELSRLKQEMGKKREPEPAE